MKRTSKRKTLIQMIVGMFIIAIAQVINHFAALPDLSLIGVGFGLLILSVIIQHFKTAN